MLFGCVFASEIAGAQSAGSASAKASGGPESADQLETVVVTANRREQNIEDVGVVVNQFSAADLRAVGAVDTKDLGQLVPGVYVAGAYGGQSQQFTIRGVVQSDYLDTIENPVAFYIDDVYITSAQGQTMSLFDVNRVEILKGPQGTLFGRNATGGLVHTLVSQPELNKVNGHASFSYGRFSEFNGEGALNLPMGEIAALRLSVQHSSIDNFWKNRYPNGAPGSAPILSFDGPGGNSVGAVVTPNGQDLGGERTSAGRLQLLVQPSDALTLRLTGSYSKGDMSVSPYTQEATIAIVDAQGRVIGEQRVSPTETRIAIGPGGTNYLGPTVLVPLVNGIYQRPAPGGNFYGYIPYDPKSLQLSEDFAQSNLDHVKAQVYAGHIDYNVGAVTLSSVTSYQKYNKEVYLGDGSPVDVLAFGAISDTTAWSQEFRLNGSNAKSRWQVGAFYLDNKVDLLQGILETSGSALANLGTVFTGNPLLVEWGGDLVTKVAFRSKSASLFGQIEYDFADRWTLIAGARLINEKQTNSYRSYTAVNLNNYKVEGAIVAAPAYEPDYDNSRTTGLWTGKLQVEHRPIDGLLLYAGINRGVKAGNYNAPFTFSPADAVPADQLSYAPEKLMSYESGFKFVRGKGLLNGSIFYYDYKDFQAFVFTTASGVVRNVDAKVYGLDLEAGYQLTKDLRIEATLAYSHATIPNFEIAPGIFRTVRPPYAPREQGSLRVEYTAPRSVGHGKVSLTADGNYAGKIYHNIRNFDAQEFPSRTLLNLAATWKSDGGGVYATVFGKNITDERYGQIGFDNTVIFGGQNVSYGKPRSYGLTLGVKY
jgi:iron complex outermembrane receptor protein